MAEELITYGMIRDKGYTVPTNLDDNEYAIRADFESGGAIEVIEKINLNDYSSNELIKNSSIPLGSDPIDISVQSYEWFYTGTNAYIYLQATGTVMGSIGVVSAGSSLNYRLVFKASKRLVISPSNVRIQFKDVSSWMDLPVYTINGGTSNVHANAGDTVTLGGTDQAFNTLIRGMTNPTAPGSYLISTIRIIREGTIIGSVDIRYMKAGN